MDTTPAQGQADLTTPDTTLQPTPAQSAPLAQTDALTPTKDPADAPEQTQAALTPQKDLDDAPTPKGTCKPDRFYALIENNTIANIFSGENLKEYNPAQLDIRELPKGEEKFFAIGLSLGENGELLPLSLEQMKERQLDFLNDDFTMEVQRVQREYIPLEEVLTFELQRQEALSLEQGGPTPFLDQLAQTRGEKKEVLARKILKKHTEYMQSLAFLVGKRHKLRNQIEESQSAQEIIDVRFSEALKL
ncbi:hypothetical protein [Helicobacter felis]|uniref:hypothetical protein n=1 Tax=Helicobacter felis TaxID=214 RepID=UPI000CEE01C6|nr:hypothetical protein [Helicobacter felis]